MHKNVPATTWQAQVHVFNYFTCLLDRVVQKNNPYRGEYYLLSFFWYSFKSSMTFSIVSYTQPIISSGIC